MCHYCDIMVKSLLHHLEHNALDGAKRNITLWSVGHELLRTMVNNENWLP